MNIKKKFFKKKPSSTFKLLSKKLEERQKELVKEFREKHKDTVDWFESKGIDVDQILTRTSKGALASVAAGMVMMSSGLLPEKNVTPTASIDREIDAGKIVSDIKGAEVIDQKLLSTLRQVLPKNVRHLNSENEKVITSEISKITGINVVAELDGNRLNTNIGKIGLEQHLPRYAGETIHDHFSNSAAENYFGRSGMTRNRGAFGYFASSKNALTQEDIEKEKYYAVVQTFASPGWGKKKGIVEWYKHRKVLIVNTQNGKAIVGAIADSGPAKWTGKSFGGSPELMEHLGMYKGNRKSPVLLFFIDESNGKVELGPV